MPPRTTSLPPLYTRSLHISVVRCPVNQLTSHSQLKQGTSALIIFHLHFRGGYILLIGYRNIRLDLTRLTLNTTYPLSPD